MIKATPPTPEEKIWNTKKSLLKKQFPFLTDEDMQHGGNKKDLLMNHLQIILGKTRSELEALIAAL